MARFADTDGPGLGSARDSDRPTPDATRRAALSSEIIDSDHSSDRDSDRDSDHSNLNPGPLHSRIIRARIHARSADPETALMRFLAGRRATGGGTHKHRAATSVTTDSAATVRSGSTPSRTVTAKAK